MTNKRTTVTAIVAAAFVAGLGWAPGYSGHDGTEPKADVGVNSSGPEVSKETPAREQEPAVREPAAAAPAIAPAPTRPADDALNSLKLGNARFIAGKPQHPHAGMDRVTETAAGQKPIATILSCSDSRLPVERIFDQGVGDVFVVRVAGNVSDTDEIGSAEYGLGHLNAPLLVVMGHTKCGAVTAVVNGASVHGSIPGLVDNIIPAVAAARQKHPSAAGAELVQFAVEENVFQSIADTLSRSEEIRALVAANKAQIVGAVYDIETGKVNWLGQHPQQASLLAAPSAPAVAHAAPQAKEDASQPAKAGSSADASTVSAAGKFVEPQFKVDQRPPFGAAAGKAKAFEVQTPAEAPSGTIFMLFAGGAVAALLLTAGTAYRFTRVVNRDGSTGHALTLGAKLAGGFGLLATGILIVACVATRASVQLATGMSRVEAKVVAGDIVSAMESDMAMMRMGVKSFLLSNDEKSLSLYSDSAASFVSKLEKAHKTVNDPEHTRTLDEIEAGIKSYEAKFAEVVSRIDERNGVIDSQMNPAGARASQLLLEIARTAHSDGDTAKALTTAEAGEHLQSARLNFFKYLRSHEDKYAEEAKKSAGQMTRLVSELKSEIKNPKRVAWLNEAEEAVRFWTGRMEHAVELQASREKLVKEGLDQIGPKIRDLTDKLTDAFQAEQNKVAEESHAQAAAAKAMVTTFSVAIAGAAAVLAFVIVRSVLRPLNKLVSTILEINTTKDLTRRTEVGTRDEVGRVGECFNDMVGVLNDIISEVNSGARQIDAGTAQISGASQSLAQGASQQAASLQQISASIEEMSSMTQQNAENAKQANAMAETSKKSTDKGVSEMKQMATAMGEIKQSSAEIGKIIKVIDEIAFQTNLLALNAAVEAARAGEAGKGFAVVAEEVRSLAQRSAEAAKNTGSMIEQATRRADNGVELAGRVGSVLDEISAATGKVNTLLAEIASASTEQAKGIGQVNTGVSELDKVTQSTAGNSEELAAGAEETAAQATSLRQLVKQFKTQDTTAESPTPSRIPEASAKRPATVNAKTGGGTPSKRDSMKAAAKGKPASAIPMTAEEDSLASF